MNAIGMSWYTRESWEQLRAIADDRRNLTYTFDEFVANAEKNIAEFAKNGIAVEKLVLDIDELTRWCRCNGYRVDKTGRTAFGAHLMVLRGMAVEGRA